jgi:hypothetical protein
MNNLTRELIEAGLAPPAEGARPPLVARMGPLTRRPNASISCVRRLAGTAARSGGAVSFEEWAMSPRTSSAIAITLYAVLATAIVGCNFFWETSCTTWGPSPRRSRKTQPSPTPAIRMERGETLSQTMRPMLRPAPIPRSESATASRLGDAAPISCSVAHGGRDPNAACSSTGSVVTCTCNSGYSGTRRA